MYQALDGFLTEVTTVVELSFERPKDGHGHLIEVALNKRSIYNYSGLPVTQTLYNLNFLLTPSNFHFPSDHFLYNFALDNSKSR